MSKKVLLIYRVDKSQKSNIGVINKLIGQVDGFAYHKVKVDYIIHDDQNIYLNNEVIYKIKSNSPKTYFKWRFFSYLPQGIVKGYSHIIIRHSVVTPSFLGFLKATKNENTKSKIFIDMPTYPYSQEWRGLKGALVLSVDGLFRRQLKNYVNNILHSGKEPELFGIPTIQFSNGINLENIKVKRFRDSSDNWVLLAIGKWQYWHGLDRLIKGLKEYVDTGKDNVQLSIVGSGIVENDLKKLVLDYNLERYVHFHGVLAGSKLDDIVDHADMGVGTLGLFRKDVVLDSSLKHREYAGRGLPFMLASEETDFSHDFSFVHAVPANEEPVDISAVVDFLEGSDPEVMSRAARVYAEKHLTWRMKMKSLLDSPLFRK